MRKFVLALAAAVLVAACAVLPQSPAQAVYQIQGDYAAVLTAAVKYKQLPACQVSSSPVCSQPSVVAQLQSADDLAYSALSAAQAAVRTPGFATDRATTIIASARAAVGAFTQIAAKLGVQP